MYSANGRADIVTSFGISEAITRSTPTGSSAAAIGMIFAPSFSHHDARSLM